MSDSLDIKKDIDARAYKSLVVLDELCEKALRGIKARMKDDYTMQPQDMALLKNVSDIMLKGIINKGISDKNESKTTNVDISMGYRELAEIATRMSTDKMLNRGDVIDIKGTIKSATD